MLARSAKSQQANAAPQFILKRFFASLRMTLGALRFASHYS